MGFGLHRQIARVQSVYKTFNKYAGEKFLMRQKINSIISNDDGAHINVISF